VGLRRNYTRVISHQTNIKDLPFPSAMTIIDALVGRRWNPPGTRWNGDGLSTQEYVAFSQRMVEIARVEYEQVQRRKVPRWILRFALNSLSLDPPPPPSVVADCLEIITIDLGCNVLVVAASDER
jgi:hypothetical protein